MTRWDAIVVGAGFAGLAAAEAAARAGLSILVLERKAAPGRPVHTTGLLCPASLEALRPPADVLGQRLDAVRIHDDRGHSATCGRRGAGFTPTDTAALLRVLAERAAAAGAEIRFGQALSGAIEEATEVQVRTGSERLHAAWLVGADGVDSRVAAAVGLARRERRLVGLERHVAVAAGDLGDLSRDEITVVLHPRWAPGYLAWAFPGRGGLWQVGTLGLAARGYHPGRALDGFQAWLAHERGFRPGRVLESRAGLVPVGGARRRPHARRTVLVGDAAGHVSALTAGGIGRAHAAGRDVGAVLAGGPAAWRHPLADQAARAGGGRRLLRRAYELTRWPPGARLAVRAAGLPWVGRLVEDLLFEVHPFSVARLPVS